jgi:hypothetical protein
MSTLSGLSPWQLDAILAHELAHVRRHDYLVNLLQAAVETLLFYHPAVWWLSNEVRRERESCCDDLAVELCGDRLAYARALAELEGLRLSPPRLALAADGGALMERVRRLVGAPVRRSRRSWLVGLLALALLPAGLALSRAQEGPGLPDAAGGGTVVAKAVVASEAILNRATVSQATATPAKVSPAATISVKVSPAVVIPRTARPARVGPATTSPANLRPAIVIQAVVSPAARNQTSVSRAMVSEAVASEAVLSATAEGKGNAPEERPTASDSAKATSKGERKTAASSPSSKLSDDLTRLLILKPSEDCLGDMARASVPGEGC